MSKGVHNIAFYVLPDPECSRTTQNSEISLAPSRGHILYAIYGNSTCIINHIVVTAIDKKYRNYYILTGNVKESVLRNGKKEIYGCFHDIVIEFLGDSVVRYESDGMVGLERIDVVVFLSDVEIMLDIELMEEIKF